MQRGAWDYVAKMGSIDQIARRLVDAFQRAVTERSVPDPDARYVDENFARLADEYAGQWIAVGKGRFLAAAERYDDLELAVADSGVAAPKFWRMPPRWERP